MPADLFLLQVKAITGTTYNFAKGETECLSVRKWKSLVDEYRTKAAANAKECRYAAYNFWNNQLK